MSPVINNPEPIASGEGEFHFLSEYRTYSVKGRSFLFSVIFHAAVVAALLVLQRTTPAQLEQETRPIYEEIIRPQEKKIIWYRLKSELPNIDSSTTRPKEGPAHGRTRSPQVAIAESKNGSPKEFVWQEAPVVLPPPVKAPNLIALHAPAVEPPAPPPPPPKAKPRDFVPPPVMPKPQPPPQPVEIPVAAPTAVVNPQVTASLPSIVQAGQVKVYRPFVAPPSQQKSTAAVGTGTSVVAAPDATTTDQQANANIAAINLDRLLGTSEVVPGRRPGNFSTAPEIGEPAAEKGGRGLVPGLTTRGRGGADSAPAVKTEDPGSIPKREVLYKEIMTHAIGSSLSIPLSPGARRIPAAVDMQFRDRPVYTMILPAPKLPQYAGDWVLWFSEAKPLPGPASAIHAPLPEKRLIPESSPYTWGTEAFIQIGLTIDAAGHVHGASILRSPADLSPEPPLEDVNAWQFKPAMRNGTPVAVDVILDIPFRRAAGVPKR
jgi:hypothetical protein